MPSLPLYPTDDGWPYPDPLGLDPATPVVGEADPVADDAVDLDLLELTADPHAYADLTALEYFAVSWRYGIGDGASPHSMKELAAELGCTHTEAREVLGGALDKLRHRLLTE